MKKRLPVFFLILTVVLFSLFPLTVSADETVPYFTYSLDKTSAASGELVKLKINANSKADTAAGFRMIINYDPAVVSFVRTENSSQIKSGTMVTNSQRNPIYSIYVCNTDKTTAPELSGNIISFVFKVNDDVRSDKTQISAHINGVCNYQAKELNLNIDEDLTLKVESEKLISTEAYLTALTPYEGTLTPQFAQDVFAYSMYVDYDVASVEFAATAGENGKVKINRKTLQKAGSATAIVATVTSADKKTASQYVITVSRAEKPSKVTADSPGGTTKEENIASAKSVKVLNQAVGRNASRKSAIDEGEEDSPEIPGTGPAADQPVEQVQQPAYAGHGDRNIYIIGNQMPTVLIAMLIFALCTTNGVALAIWLKIQPKK